MDKKKEIAFEFFNHLERDSKNNLAEIFRKFSEEKSINGAPHRHRFKGEIIRYFNYLYGLKETFPMFVEWIIKYKKIHILNGTIFIFRDLDSLYQQGLSWTEILLRPDVRQSINWIYNDGKLLEIDDSISLGDTTKGKHGISPERALEICF
jgi:hypothetical protein